MRDDNRKKTVLIVDEAQESRALLGELFRDEYGIAEAGSGGEAIAFLERESSRIVMVLLDVAVHEADGFGVLEYMRGRGLLERISVCLITSERSDELVLRGYDMGITDVIGKPFNPEVVRRRVRNSIELLSRRQSLEQTVESQSLRLKQQAMQLRESNFSLIDALSAAIEFRDCESGMHIQHMRTITRALLYGLAEQTDDPELTPERIEVISRLSALHDVGKIAIPDYILNKPGKLTPEEFALMKEHTLRGYEILRTIPWLEEDPQFRCAFDICRSHHERWDGRGYPDGLKGDQIPVCAQVVSLADVYDALVSKRVYKKAYSHEEAVRMILAGECGAFNPVLIDCFVQLADSLDAIRQTGEEPLPLYYERQRPGWVTRPAQGAAADNALNSLERFRRRYGLLAKVTQELYFEYNDAEDAVRLFGDLSAYRCGEKALLKSCGHILNLSRAERAAIERDVAGLTKERPSLYRTLCVNGRQYELLIVVQWSDGEDSRRECVFGRVRPMSQKERFCAVSGVDSQSSPSMI